MEAESVSVSVNEPLGSIHTEREQTLALIFAVVHNECSFRKLVAFKFAFCSVRIDPKSPVFFVSLLHSLHL